MPDFVSKESTPESGFQATKRILPNAVATGVSPDRKTTYLVCNIQSRQSPCNPQNKPSHFQTIVEGKVVVQTIVDKKMVPTDIIPILCSACPINSK